MKRKAESSQAQGFGRNTKKGSHACLKIDSKAVLENERISEVIFAYREEAVYFLH